MAKKPSVKEINERKAAVAKRLEFFSNEEIDVFLSKYGFNEAGINEELEEQSREEYGVNKITKEKKDSVFKRLYEAFVNPFTSILFVLALVSLVTDIILVAAHERNWVTFIIIMVMVAFSGLLRFVQETRSNQAAEKLSQMVETTTGVYREGTLSEIPLDEVVVGDIVRITAGDIIPADVRIIKSKDLFVGQSALTGESEPVEKFGDKAKETRYDNIIARENLAFMGSTVVSGSGRAIVVSVGDDTVFGQAAKNISQKPPKTGFEKGINSVSWILIRFMLIMVPIVFFINWITKRSLLDAFLFAISIAVGLTPEMLPMIVTTCLAKGAVRMSKKKTIIKNLNSIQNFGAMDVLCTDKTGTLTMDKVVLERHLNVKGQEDARVLRHAYLNSYFQTGLKNLMDLSIIEKRDQLEDKYAQLKDLHNLYIKVDEIPFDFSRRRMSVVVEDKNGKRQMITKGAVEEILSVCSFVEYNGRVEPLTKEIKAEVSRTVDSINAEGMRVIAVAQKTNPAPVGAFGIADENEMVLIGYLSFLDPPKETTAAAIKALHARGVNVKILTGDNDKVTVSVCHQVGLNITNILLGADVEDMSDEMLKIRVEDTNIFAKLAPDQKARVVRILRENGHVVGYMGDGINDAAALKAADVGISVDTAVDIAKESANIILLEKDLTVLEQGIIEGRKIYANMIKYIKMTASSNFGNMFSVLAASVFLPFLPMMPLHLILLSLIYDLSCTAIPWDNVDKEFISKPRKWEAASVGKFMLWIGPISSIFDITTYLLMYFVICPQVIGAPFPGIEALRAEDPNAIRFMHLFQAGWFIESMWTQTLVIHLIRTNKIPFIQSRASAAVTVITFAGIAVLTAIPFINGLNTALRFVAPPPVYFLWLALTIVLYMCLVTFVKKLYIRRYGELL